MKYKYNSKTFKAKDIIELPDNVIVLHSNFVYAHNHHKYENIHDDTLYLTWLEPVIEKT